jgi:hypothetical protein
MTPLPDTPRWSPWRRGTINTVLMVGIAMIAVAAFGERPEAVALELIRSGASILTWAAATIVFGAGAERAVAWWKGSNQEEEVK